MNAHPPEQVVSPLKLKPDDYASDQELRWCPGCGDYAIIKSVRKTLAELQVSPDQTVFVSGIGCAARFPYYMDTYGFHTIHGRAPSFATGIKLTRPDLDVWIVSGDGDSMAIGGNHLQHLLRRDLDVQFLLFNNEIYGLTKGQASPTSRMGTLSPSTPGGSTEQPVHPCRFALGSGASFIARSFDTDQRNLPDILKAAHRHGGVGFVEILQNCIVYNDAIFDGVTAKKAHAHRIYLRHGEKMIYGDAGQYGLRLDPARLVLEAVEIGEDGVREADICVHDEANKVLAGMLIEMAPPRGPLAFGVLYRVADREKSPGVPSPTSERIAAIRQPDRGRLARLQLLINGEQSWRVE